MTLELAVGSLGYVWLICKVSNSHLNPNPSLHPFPEFHPRCRELARGDALGWGKIVALHMTWKFSGAENLITFRPSQNTPESKPLHQRSSFKVLATCHLFPSGLPLSLHLASWGIPRRCRSDLTMALFEVLLLPPHMASWLWLYQANSLPPKPMTHSFSQVQTPTSAWKLGSPSPTTTTMLPEETLDLGHFLWEGLSCQAGAG